MRERFRTNGGHDQAREKYARLIGSMVVQDLEVRTLLIILHVCYICVPCALCTGVGACAILITTRANRGPVWDVKKRVRVSVK